MMTKNVTAEQIAQAMQGSRSTYSAWREHVEDTPDPNFVRAGKYVPDELCSSHLTWDEVRNLCDRVF